MFPSAWKEAEIIPLLKDGDHEVASNNRPLSHLAVASKVCEKVVLNQFNTYLQRKRLSDPTPKRQSQTALHRDTKHLDE
jgi:hypothetical protein